MKQVLALHGTPLSFHSIIRLQLQPGLKRRGYKG